jgi:hypothetical protein
MPPQQEKDDGLKQPKNGAGVQNKSSSEQTQEKVFGLGKENESRDDRGEICTENNTVVSSLFDLETEKSNIGENNATSITESNQITTVSKNKEHTAKNNKNDDDYDVDTGFGVNSTTKSNSAGYSKNMSPGVSQPKVI